MDTIRKIFITVAAAVLLPGTGSVAQTASEDGNASVSDIRMELGDDDTVRISFMLHTVKKDLPATESLVLKPFAMNAGETRYLRTIRVERPYKELKDRRARILSGDRSEPAYILLEAGDSMRISEAWAYQEWMEHLTLGMTSYREGCCGVTSAMYNNTLTDSEQIYFPPIWYSPLVSMMPVPKFLIEEMAAENSFISASQDDDADRSAALAFQFRQGSSYLDLNLDDNREKMKKVNDALKAIAENSDVRLRKVIMTGYASVEGSRSLNERLAMARARSVLETISASVRPDEAVVELISGGEDWEDLLEKVQADKMVPDRDSVLSILTDVPDTEERKVLLKNMKEAYRYLLDVIFPKQRSAGYLQLFFDVVKRSDINQRIALRFNEAVTAASAGDYDKVETILKMEDLPLPEERIWNLRGVCSWMQGDLDEAGKCFRKALELNPGQEDARKNLDMLEEWDEHHFLQEMTVIETE